ncbi:MAG: 30S ribosomal protein S27e [Candidatus Heimdallarchaeaceae archaeon]
MKFEIKGPKSKFIKVKCKKCKNEQIIFGKTSTVVKCLVCNSILANPTGGKAKIRARVLEVLE